MPDGTRFANVRDAWLGQAAEALSHDPRVTGWGLVGSFGRGEADSWSDVDLLVIVRDHEFGTFIDPERNPLWSTAQLLIDARRNAPVGATSVATVCVRSGLPIGADWYLYPSSMAGWPRDCAIEHGADAAPRSSLSFARWNGEGPRNEPIEISPTEERQARLAMVPVAGKYLARRSPKADGVLQSLGAPARGPEPGAQLEALEDLVADLAIDCPAWMVAAVSEYLTLVARTLG